MNLTKLNLAAVALGLVCSSTALYAATIPQPSFFDPRIRDVMYNPDDVVMIKGWSGTSTLIKLEPGETIQDVPEGGLSIGDNGAWTLAVRGPNIFLKPKVEKSDQPDTNINLVSNKRTYAMRLEMAASEASSFYQVRYKYPAVVVPYKAPVVDRGPCSDGPINRNYFMYGDRASMQLAPAEAWDDGRFTCLRFPTSRALPNVYRYEPGNDVPEGIPSTNVKDDVVVIHEVSPEFRLRIGNLVLGVKTDSLVYAPFNRKQTTIPNTERVLKNVD